ncbi:MAG: hypothetical protein WBD55_08615 [Dehalococcoidia bacterium]
MRVTLLSTCALVLFLLACTSSADTASEPTVRPPQPTLPQAPPLTNAAESLDIPTYDGSGQAAHPDVVSFADGWGGHTYWMVMTPYPYDTSERENPSLLVSEDGQSWVVPAGVTDPLVSTPPCDHNSDPDLVYDPQTDELMLYYTEVLRPQFCGAGTNTNSVKLMTSSDGVAWSEPKTVMEFDLGRYPVYVSPAVVYRGGRFEMWMAGNDDTLVYTTSDDGEAWAPLQEGSLPDSLWHLDVQYVAARHEYWMLYATLPGTGGELKFARSADGLDWDMCEQPVLQASSGWDSDRIYRSTFLYDEARNMLRVWYSARDGEGVWGIGYTEGGHPGLSGGAC